MLLKYASVFLLFNAISALASINQNDICLMQSGMFDLYTVYNSINSIYTNIILGSNPIFDYYPYDATTAQTGIIVTPYTGEGSCGTIDVASGLYPNSVEVINATYQEMLNVGTNITEYLAPAMLNICISNNTCTLGVDITTDDQYSVALGQVTAFLNNNYALSMAALTAPYNAVSRFCLKGYGQELSSIFANRWQDCFELFTLHYWQFLTTSQQKTILQTQANISSIIPPNMNAMEALAMSSIFYGSHTNCDYTSYFIGPPSAQSDDYVVNMLVANIKNHVAKAKIASAAAAGDCNSGNQNSNNAIDLAVRICSGVVAYATHVFSGFSLSNVSPGLIGRAITNFALNFFPPLYTMFESINSYQEQLNLSPTAQLLLDDAIIAASIAIAPEFGIVDFTLDFLTLGCDTAALARETYRNIQSCCAAQCSSLLCSEYQSVCLRTAYSGTC